jgi:hypothetical protein
MTEHWLMQIVFLIAAGVVSSGIAMVVIIRLPADYLSALPPSAPRKVRMGWLDLFVGFLRNLLGLALVGLGALLSLPAVPGQGLLTIFAGLMLMDLPGKRWILIRVFRQRRLLQAVNSVRAKWSRPPLLTR